MATSTSTTSPSAVNWDALIQNPPTFDYTEDFADEDFRTIKESELLISEGRWNKATRNFINDKINQKLWENREWNATRHNNSDGGA